MSGVGGDVPALVVAMDGEVQPQQLDEHGTVVTQHGSKIGSPIQILIDGNYLSVLVDVPVYEGCETG